MPGATATRNPTLRRWQWFEFEQRQRHALAQQAPRYDDDPVGWVTHTLGDHLWSKQRDILLSVRDHRRTAVPSAHGTGKSFTAARLAAWWIASHPPGEAFVVTTAPTEAQVKAVLWREMRRAHTAGKLTGHMNMKEWYVGDELVALGRKPNDYDPSAFQGIHARNLLVVIDEACGVPESIYHAANSLAANEHSRILAIGNPDDPASYFAKVCKPDSGWHVIPVDGLASPNFTDEPLPDTLRDLLIGPTYVAEMRQDVGEDSPIYLSKVRGQFPENAADGVVLLSWVRRCQQREDVQPGLPVELGVDVGAGGDETVIRERRGQVAGRNWRSRTPDSMDAVGKVLAAIHETGATRVKVDAIGIGWGVAGRLTELRQQDVHAAEIVPVNVGETAPDAAHFPKLRDQLWWDVGRELSRSQGWDLAAVDETTIGQLIAPTYALDSAGRIKIEAKADTRKRLGRSPDDADALLLAFANVERVEPVDETVVLDEPVFVSPF